VRAAKAQRRKPGRQALEGDTPLQSRQIRSDAEMDSPPER
jgi:hypothetical protein